MDGITNAMNMNVGKAWEMVRNRDAWRATVHGVTKSWTDWATQQQQQQIIKKFLFFFSLSKGRVLELTPQKDVLFIIGDWNAKVGSQETPGVTGKFRLGIQMNQDKG